MRMLRLFTPTPNPCSRCWEMNSSPLPDVTGLKSLRRLLLSLMLLLKPSCAVVPVRKPWETLKLNSLRRWIIEVVPVRNVEVLGDVKCPQLRFPVRTGSRLAPAAPDPPLPTELLPAL